MVKQDKFLDTQDKEEIYDNVMEKKAIPELILKANILQAQDNLLMTERTLMNNYRQYNRFIKDNVIAFEGDLVLLWSFIRQMVEEQKVSPEDKKYYQILLDLEMGKNNIRVEYLLLTKNYLMKCLHRINITNLFQNKGQGFEQGIKTIHN